MTNKQKKNFHILYSSPNRIPADEVKCKHTICLCKWGAEPQSWVCSQTPCQTSELSLVPNFELGCETNTVCACVCVWVCDWQPPVKSSLLYLLFSVLSAALHYELLLPTCLWHFLKATWTFSLMFCDHKLIKCYPLHSAKGHHVNDKES